MRNDEPTNLTEKQELLLSAYADSECSFISRILAERLLRNNPNAQAFITHLRSSSTLFKNHAGSQELNIDLWDRISNRIDAEEKAAFYLGQRRPTFTEESPPLWARFKTPHAALGGLSGAAIAAMVLVLVARPSKPGEILPVYTGGPVAAQNSSAFHQASFGAETGTTARSPMEVDWMRGNGSVRLITNPNGQSATIWVRKKAPAQAPMRRAIATPTIRVLQQEGLDVPPVTRSK